MIQIQEEFLFIWLSIIDGINYQLFLNLKKVFHNIENIYKISSNIYLFKDYLNDNNLNIDQKIFNQLTNSNIKLKSQNIYSNVQKLNLKVITLNSKYYPNELLSTVNPKLCIIIYGNTKILADDKPKIYMYYNKNFSSNGKNVYNTFIDFLKKENVTNIFNIEKIEDLVKFQVKKSSNIYLINKSYNIENNEELCQAIKQDLSRIDRICNKDYDKSSFIFNNLISNDNRIEILSSLLDHFLVPEAAYQEEIVSLTDVICEYGKNILVVPSDIYKNTSYFSNYLIKQGCDVILSTKDIKYYIDNFKRQ